MGKDGKFFGNCCLVTKVIPMKPRPFGKVGTWTLEKAGSDTATNSQLHEDPARASALERWGFIMMTRMVLHSWVQVSHLPPPWPPK
ncbi:hypothetical protein AAY473_004737, partial [Plecturocebus cupreus]